MDGTIADLYGDPEWLSKLRALNAEPYATAKPLVNMQALAHRLNRLQKKGWRLGVVSWLSKEPEPTFDEQVSEAKRKWLATHLASVKWDRVDIIAYGEPKGNGRQGILFDDEAPNRKQWGEGAYDATEIMAVLGRL